MDKLAQADILTEVVTIAAGGSCYFRFMDERMGKCRVGDHNERQRYGYKWQMRSDIDKAYVDSSKGHKQFFYPSQDVDAAASHMINYYAAIHRNNAAKSPSKPKPAPVTVKGEVFGVIVSDNYDEDCPF